MRPPTKIEAVDAEAVFAHVGTLEEGHAIHFLNAVGSAIEVEEPEHVALIGKHDTGDTIHIIVLTDRVEAMLAMTYVEERLFPPSDPRASASWDARMLKWEGLFWHVVTVPVEKRALIEQILAVVRLRLADGVPSIIDVKGQRFFPINLPNAYNVEFTGE